MLAGFDEERPDGLGGGVDHDLAHELGHQGVVIDDTELFNAKLQEWENFYNYDRPHGGLGGQTPYERYDKRPSSSCSGHRQLHKAPPGGLEPPHMV